MNFPEKEDLKDDIKVIFDFLRNLGICAGILAAIPSMDSSIDAIDSYIPVKLIQSFTFGVFIVLYLYNIFWLFQSLKAKSFYKFKIFSLMSSTLMVALLTVIMLGFTITKVWPVLF